MLTLPNGEPLSFTTRGFNPYFTTEKEITKIVQNIPDISPYADLISEVYFFGSGCTNPDRREMVSNALSEVFKHAFISVETDLIGSAYATCGNDSGYTAVLGTGSNVTFFDGEQVQPTKQGLGFILGDEGSGAWFGKKLLTNFLYQSMPDDLMKEFESTYHINKEIVIKNVYQRNYPNTYLASFAPFMESNKTHPYIQYLLQMGFEEFVKTNILLFPDYRKHLFHFVGSIAYYFSEQLRAVCERHAIQIGKIIKRPIEELFNFVIERETGFINSEKQ